MPNDNPIPDPGASFLPAALPSMGNATLIEDYRPGQEISEVADPGSPYAVYVPEAADFPLSAFHLRFSVMTLPEYGEYHLSGLPLARRRRLRLKRDVQRRLPGGGEGKAWRGLLDRIGPPFAALAEKAQLLAGDVGPRLKDEWERFVGAIQEADEAGGPQNPGQRLLELFQDLERAGHSVHAEALIAAFESLTRDELAAMLNTVRSAKAQGQLSGPEFARQRSGQAARLTARLKQLYAAAGVATPAKLGELSQVAESPVSNRIDYNKALTDLFRQVDKDAAEEPALAQAFDRLTEHDLSAFFETAGLKDEKKQVVDQAILIIEQLYAHLPYKRARYAIDPVQRLRLLRSRLEVPFDGGSESGRVSDAALTEMQFHEEMFEIFKSLRDPHTYYQLPPIYDNHKAFVPFLMASYGEAGSRKFVVTQIAEWFCGSHTTFQPGAEVTHWNGLPIEEAVMQNGEREGGNSVAARFARGLLKMTVRTLRYGMPPKEEWVHLRYLAVKTREPREMILPWLVWTLPGVNIFDTLADLEKSLAARAAPEGLLAALAAGSAQPEDGRYLSVSPDITETNRTRISGSKDRRREQVERLRQQMLAEHLNPYDLQQSLTGQQIQAAWNVEFDPQTESYLPDVFEFRLLDKELSRGQPHNLDAGYIRIRTFSFSPHQHFVDEFRRILRIMENRAPDGLVIDVRGNGGGKIPNGERILQLISPRRIVPEKFHFLASSLTRTVAASLSDEASLSVEQTHSRRFARRDFDATTRASTRESLVSGESLVRSGSFITAEDDANDIGQEYHGPVALIVDALSYSTTDMFAAGFQDHEIGPIIGVDTNTGGGGANVWNYESDLLPILGPVTDAVKPVADGTRMGVAVRRCYRSGKNAGLAIEDVGVRADAIHVLTREDLVPAGDRGHDDDSRKYRDLLAFAVQHLAALKRARLTITAGDWQAAKVGATRSLSVSYQAGNIDRLEFYVNGIPQCTITVPRAPGADSTEASGSLEVPAEGIDLTKVESIVLEVRGYRRESREPVAAVRKTGPG